MPVRPLPLDPVTCDDSCRWRTCNIAIGRAAGVVGMERTPDTPGDNRQPVLLVAYDGGSMSEMQLHLACRAANDINARVRVVHVIAYPLHIPLEQPLPKEEEDGVSVLLDRAEAIAKRYDIACDIVV